MKKFRFRLPHGVFETMANSAAEVQKWHPMAIEIVEVESVWDKLKKYFRFEIR